MLIYDIEIIKAVPSRNEDRQEGIKYCKGWNDHKGMGISVICAYDEETDRTRCFMEDNFSEFQELAGNRIVSGFNSISFDDSVCRHNGIKVATGYDLLVELWKAAGLADKFEYPSHIGFGLGATAVANGSYRQNRTRRARSRELATG